MYDGVMYIMLILGITIVIVDIVISELHIRRLRNKRIDLEKRLKNK